MKIELYGIAGSYPFEYIIAGTKPKGEKRMTSILHISSSSNLEGSVTREIGAIAVETLRSLHPEAKLIVRDLVKQPPPHIGPEFVGAMFTNPEASELALSRAMIDELVSSDVIVIEAPMYNFTIPSVLKAWIDHVVRSGVTVKYGPDGVEGLLKGKKVILILGRGGVYSAGPMKAMEYQENYLRAILGFVGLTDIETITAEGVARGPELRAKALANAKTQALNLMKKAA
jgi:FMN-dependent NADH-azoreductase